MPLRAIPAGPGHEKPSTAVTEGIMAPGTSRTEIPYAGHSRTLSPPGLDSRRFAAARIGDEGETMIAAWIASVLPTVFVVLPLFGDRPWFREVMKGYHRPPAGAETTDGRGTPRRRGSDSPGYGERRQPGPRSAFRRRIRRGHERSSGGNAGLRSPGDDGESRKIQSSRRGIPRRPPRAPGSPMTMLPNRSLP